MDLGSYSDASVGLMVELVNSLDFKRDPAEQLADVPALEEFLGSHGMLGPNRAALVDLEQIRALRSSIRAVFEAPSAAAAIVLLNKILAEAGVRPWIAEHDDGTREIFFAAPDAPLTRRVTCDAGIGLAMMMVEHADRLKVCAADPCRNVFVDASRNRSRRWCSEGCAARVNVAAYRARQRDQSAK